MSEAELTDSLTGVAIIGMSGRFPGAPTLEAFWRNLCDGVESVTLFADEDARISGVDPRLLGDPRYVKARAVLDGVEQFDAAFFGYTPHEAAIIDPQQRLFLECAWAALEHAGYDAETYTGTIGLYGGAAMNYYLLTNLYPNREVIGLGGEIQAQIGNDKDHLTTRVAYKLNLTGPSVTVQTACSTALVAVCMACQSLLGYHCDMALAGGVSLGVPGQAGYLYQEGGIGSPDGHCRAFDAQGQGTVGGDGVGVVVLKRLEDALADGDTIHAVIMGFGINNDGAAKAGYTAPSVQGQTQAIAAAHAIAGIDPATISYVEAHGTATALGDPIEIAALTQAFRAGTDQTGFCAIGSVKTNIGHLNTAAGIAGLIKTVLALKHKRIPPSLHFHQPNPAIDFAGSPFYVNTRLAAWRAGATPRRAGVSSFGMGGTNAHVVLEEAPAVVESEPARPWQLLLLSAKTATALDAATANLAAYLDEHPGVRLADVAYTLQVGRRAFDHRRAILCRDGSPSRAALSLRDPQQLQTQILEPQERPIVFMFPGQGAQYVNMARELHATEPVFREQVDRCAELLLPHLGLDLREVLYSEEQRTKNKEQNREHQPEEPRTKNQEPTTDYQLPTTDHRPTSDPARTITPSPLHPFTPSPLHPFTPSLAQSPIPNPQSLDQTWLTQPALFVVEYALARQWMAWGIQPQALIGHSFGEYVAACLAGVFSLEDALALVVMRGRLMQRMPEGAMLGVTLPAGEVRPLLGARLALAAINGPSLCVVSGPLAAIAELERTLAAQGVDCRRLHADSAPHSALIEPVLEPLTAFVRTLKLRAPRIPYLSNVTGTWISADEATDPGYWARHLRETVRFADAIQMLLADPSRILLEVGPGQTLTALTKLQAAPDRIVLASTRHPHDQSPDDAFVLNTLAQLWLAGARVDWAGFYARERRRRLPLPTYPFERQRYWIDAAPQAVVAPPAEPLRKKPDLADWIYLPSWKRSLPPLAASDADRGGSWLVFVDDEGLGEQLVERLRQRGRQVVSVAAGSRWARLAPDAYAIAPDNSQDYLSLIEELRAQGTQPTHVAHLWNVTAATQPERPPVLAADTAAFYSLLFLAQALGKQQVKQTLRLTVVSNAMQAVANEPALIPEKALLLGPCQVIPQEYPNITCRSIDIITPGPGGWAERLLIDQLLAELEAQVHEPVVAYRGRDRWTRTFEAVRLERSDEQRAPLREGGVYLITGGLGGMGLVLAEELARTVRARLVLVGRSALPEREIWEQWLAAHPADDPLARKLRGVLALEEHGAEVLLCSADVSDAVQMRAVVARALERFGALHGVIHAAGIAGGGMIQLKTPAAAEQVLAPKVAGTRVLAAALADVPLDFLALCSSLASVVGGFGRVDYCAANAFLDAFAHASAARNPTSVIAINWDAWQEVGMAADAVMRHDGAAEDQLSEGISSREGAELFERILGRAGTAQVVVSTRDLAARAAEVRALSQSLPALEELRPARAGHPRPATMQTHYTAPRTALEEQIAAVWQRVLGIEPVGVDDHFFALGGHSLLAVQAVSHLQTDCGIAVSLQTLFEAPTVAALATRVMDERRARLAEPDQEHAALPASPPITPRTGDRGVAELSFAQQRLWFLDQLAPGMSAYNMPAAVRLSGSLDVAALRRSLSELVRRHEILRTSFALVEERPVQVIAPVGQASAALPPALIDLRGVPPDDREAAAQQLAAAELQRPFDLAQGPLLRAIMLRMDAREHALMLTMHHIISDAWSVGVLIRELTTLYRAFAAGRPSSLPPLPIQYADFAVWQRAWLQGSGVRGLGSGSRSQESGVRSQETITPLPPPAGGGIEGGRSQESDVGDGQTQNSKLKTQNSPLEVQLAYWEAQLAGIQTLDLPSDRPRPPVATYRGANQIFTLPARLSEALKALTQQEGGTLFMTLLAALQTLLLRYTGQDDIAVSSAVANRSRAELEALIGCFINILVLRTDASGNPSFRTLLQRVRDVCRGAYAHQDLPFELLVEQLQPKRDLSRNPLAQVMFIVQNAPRERIELEGLAVSPVVLSERAAAEFDLTMHVWEHADGLSGQVTYNIDLFDATTIMRMLGHFQTLLDGIVAEPGRRLADLALLTDGERRQLLGEWNASHSAYPHDQCIHQLFQAQAARTPDAVALFFDRPTTNDQPPTTNGVTRRQGDKETRSQESGVRSQELEFLAPNIQHPTPYTRHPTPNTQHLTPNTQHLTYRELNVRANQLAHYLQARGVGPEVRVGIHLERSPDMLIGLLGVLKAGGAYVPLDPHYPQERLTFMIEDAQVQVLITTTAEGDKETRRQGGEALQEPRTKNQEPRDDEELRTQNSKLKTQNSVTVSPLHPFTLSESWPAISLCAADNPVGVLDPDNPAYVIYTSGSTGTPKGVLGLHRGAVNRFAWMWAAYPFAPGERGCQKTSLNFLDSLWELFGPTPQGVPIVLIPDEAVKDPYRLVSLLADTLVTRIVLVPSLLRALLESHPDLQARLPRLRYWVTSGEALPIDLCERFLAELPDRVLLNLYGSSEVSADATSYLIAARPTRPAVPIGRPIANTSVYLLDPQLQPAPIGVPGEVAIGGVGLARGYHGRPDLTAERFIPNPFTDFGLPILDFGLGANDDPIQNPKSKIQNGARLYRTGDLARYLPDGVIEYLGRRDQQVKVRGYRIELGEVEAALRRHPAVSECVIAARQDLPGDTRLVAYIVEGSGVRSQESGVRSQESGVRSQESKDGERQTQNHGLSRVEGSKLKTQNSKLPSSPIPNPQSPIPELRDFLKQRLPDYMVPAAFVLLDALPLTPSGKVDRRLLPAPDPSALRPADAFVAPRTPAEELLASVWAQILHVDRVGIHDNFFDLGGHSLLATQVVSRVRALFHVALSLRQLFEAPTVAGLAEAIATTRRAGQGWQVPPLQPAGRDGVIPLSFAQQRLWFLAQLQPNNPFYTIPAALRLRGPLAVAALQRSLSDVVQRHEVLRTTFVEADGRPCQVITPALATALPLLDLRGLPIAECEQATRRLADAQVRRPFDLARGPLLRAALLRLDEELHVLTLTLHHIVADGWSLGVLVREIAALYAFHAHETPAALPDLAVQYADYAIWQRTWLQGSGVGGQGVTAPLPPPAGGGTEGGRSQESGVGEHQTQNHGLSRVEGSKLKTQNSPLEVQLAYWRAQLAGVQTLDLPTDRPRPPVQTFRGATYSFELPAPLVAALHAVSRQAGCTLFMTLLAAFQTLLARYTGQDDIVVGSPVAGRTQPETEALIGCFVNTLVLRADLSGDPRFRALLGRVREMALEAYVHQDLPFEQLVEKLQLERDLSRTPLFQVMFALQNTPAPALELPGLSIHPDTVTSGAAKFDLSLSMAEIEDGLAGMLEYNTDLFDAATVARMAGHLQTLLASAAADPDQGIAALPLLTDEERRQLLVDWGQGSGVWGMETTTPLPPPAGGGTEGGRSQESGVRSAASGSWCLHQLFEAQAAVAPDAVAVVFDRGQGSGVWGQEAAASLPPPAGGGTEGGRAWASETLSPQSSVLSPQHLTYRELNERANRLAHHIQRLGVGPDVPVGVLLERSIELLVAWLAVLKAGGAYLPLDPATPALRLAGILHDAQAPVLLTQKSIYDLRFTIYDLPTNDDQRSELKTQNSKLKTPMVVCLDTQTALIAAQPETSPDSRVEPENLAYVIYTSGSTGVPKGVLIAHAGLSNLVDWHRQTYDITPADRASQVAGVAFDACGWEVWPYLAMGASVHFPGEGMRADPARLVGWLAAQAITISFLPTPLAEAALQVDWPADMALRVLLTGGDRLRWGQAAWPVAVVNHYGPTEATVVSTCAALVELSTNAAPPPIGRPIANAQAYVLDARQQPVPIGIPGELYVAGIGLARGYLGQPDLTAEWFIPNPFADDRPTTNDQRPTTESQEPRTKNQQPMTNDESETQNSKLKTQNLRLYRTGDLVRYRPDGNIEFLGRIDAQVKLRGFRIELGEVEAVLAQHPAVREGVVLARADALGDVRLVAYLVTSHKPQVTSTENSSLVTRHSSLVTELRAFLKERLPEYMVPSAFVLLDVLPLTSNGKVDRAALPAPAPSAPASSAAPRTPAEQQIAGIWAAVLGVQQVGRDDDFFALGGHSLLATQLMSRLRDAFQVELPLQSLFETPTVAGLATLIVQKQAEQLGRPATIQPQPRKGNSFPLSFAQQRLWFLDQLLPGNPLYNVPVAIQLTGLLDLPALAHSLNAVVQRHEALRTTFAIVEGQPAQVIASTLNVPLPLLDLAGSAAQRQPALDRLLLAEAQYSFELARGPLVRALLVRLDASTHLLLLTIHHIVTDGWSMNLLVRDLAMLYTARLRQQPPALPNLPIQYADYAVWQREWLEGSGARGQGSGPALSGNEGRQADKQTRPVPSGNEGRQADKEIRPSVETGPPTPNTQHPTPIQAQLAYWKEQLAGLPPVLELPSDRPRPPFPSLRGARQTFSVAPELSAALGALGRQERATLFMTLLSAFGVLLARWSGQQDIVVGAPIANRTHTEIEDLIGFFVNTLVLRSDLRGNPSFRALLGRVRAMVLAAQQHQDLPFEKLVEELQPVRDPSHHPLFQVMLVLQNVPNTGFELPDLTLRSITTYNQTAKFDLWLELVESPQGLRGTLEHATDLFDEATISRLRGHFLTLLSSIVAAPDLPISALPLLTAQERAQILGDWNATAAAFPHASCIHDLFAAQAERTPDALALLFGAPPTTDHRPPTTDYPFTPSPLHPFTPSPLHPFTHPSSPPALRLSPIPQHLTYSDLAWRAQLLAQHLHVLGVRPGDRVGICMPRSLEMVVGLLGILSAGAAYVPLDPASPAARLAFMLHDAQLAVLLTQRSLRPSLPSAPTAQDHRTPLLLELDPGWEQTISPDDTPFLPSLSASHLGYVIYTSGSTGKPKGVALSHRALVNLLHWQLPYLEQRQGTRFVQFASLSFDVSYQEIFPTLASGGVVVLIDEQLRRDARALWQLLDRERVERIYLPYVGLQHLAAAAAADPSGPAPAHLRQITVSGEQLQITAPIREMFERLAPCTLHNFYGPSESHAVSSETLRGAPEQWPALVPIGRPIANSQLYVLDREMQLLPAGVLGELYIGGECLADGYLARPELTAERFIPNPFADFGLPILDFGLPEAEYPIQNPKSKIQNGTRLYKTGDLARYLPDGRLVFLGRIDAQVKVRGFRVELEEVAAVLRQHERVQECVVLLRADGAGERRLVAYVVTSDKSQVTSSSDSSLVTRHLSLVSELRAYLKTQLPEYMVPWGFVVMERLPLTINGKVDTRALPIPEGEERGAQAYEAPQTAMELALAQVWAELLGVERVGRTDNFFALGGHSLLGTQLVTQVRVRLGLELPLRVLFAAPRLAELAAEVEGLAGAARQVQFASVAREDELLEEGEL